MNSEFLDYKFDLAGSLHDRVNFNLQILDEHI